MAVFPNKPRKKLQVTFIFSYLGTVRNKFFVQFNCSRKLLIPIDNERKLKVHRPEEQQRMERFYIQIHLLVELANLIKRAFYT